MRERNSLKPTCTKSPEIGNVGSMAKEHREQDSSREAAGSDPAALIHPCTYRQRNPPVLDVRMDTSVCWCTEGLERGQQSLFMHQGMAGGGNKGPYKSSP